MNMFQYVIVGIPKQFSPDLLMERKPESKESTEQNLIQEQRGYHIQKNIEEVYKHRPMYGK
jgi:hypothetical protein